MKSFVSNKENFEFNSKVYRKPVKFRKDRCYIIFRVRVTRRA